MIESALVIVPAYNEAEVIEQTLEELKHYARHIVVVDDGSIDDTKEKAEKMGVKVLRHCTNFGYGGALKTGFGYGLRYFQIPYFISFDADGQHDPFYLEHLLKPLLKNEVDYVLGSRFIGTEPSEIALARKLGSKIFGITTSAILGQKISDPTSGMIALNRKVAKIFTSKFFPLDFPDADVLIMLKRMGFRIKEVGVKMRKSRRAGSMHSGIIKPVYYLAKMSVSMIHFTLRGDLKEKRREIEGVF